MHLTFSSKLLLALTFGTLVLADLGLVMPVCAETASSPYWVSLDGSDANPGTESQPFATVQHAVEQAAPGSIITVGPGVFHSRIVIRRSGAEGKPITIRGTRDADGKLLTRIEGGSAIDTVDWEPAPEIAPGVYKTTRLRDEPQFITLNGLSLARLNRVAGGFEEDGSRKLTAREVLTWPDGPVAQSPVPNVDVWAALGGAYTYDNGTLYMRLKDAVDVRQQKLVVAPGGPIIQIDNAAHIHLRDLEVGGGETGVMVDGSKAQHNRIEECRVLNGRVRIKISGGASDTSVLRNVLSMGFLGQEPGPWWSDINVPVNETLSVRRFLYRYFKTFASEKTTSDDRNIQIMGDAVRTRIEGNQLVNGLIGIEAGNTTDLVIKDNLIRNHSSVGMALRAGSKKVYVSHNEIRDCNISIRLHEMNSPSGHELYLWGNRCYQPEGVGTQLYAHFLKKGKFSVANSPEWKSLAFVYHNTFVGGFRGVYLAAPVAENCPQFLLVNNLLALQDRPIMIREPKEPTPRPFVLFAANWIIGGAIAPGKWPDAATNVVTPGTVAINDDGTVEGEGGHTGIDVSESFTVDGIRFEPLPGFASGYFSGPKPDPGAVQRRE